MSGWGAALRMARRDASRAKGRSALVVAMIALPITAAVAVDVLARTAQLDVSERIEREMGGADAVVTPVRGRVVQPPDLAAGYGVRGDEELESDAAALRAALPPGTTVLEQVGRDAVPVRTTGGRTRIPVMEVDAGAPALTGVYPLRDGRLPRGTDEVALTPALLEQTGLRLGERFEVIEPPTALTVVGVVRNSDSLGERAAVAVPGALPRSAGEGASRQLFVDGPGEITWPQVRALNERGFAVQSRAVLLHPPPRSQVDPQAYAGQDGQVAQVVAGVTLAVGLVAFEVVLLAGAAIAVGVRRQTRDLALVAAAGGSPKDVRRVVLAGGLVLGAVAGLLGVALGTGAAAAALPLLERLGGATPGRFDVRPLELAGCALVAVVTGLLATLVPARAVSRLDPVAALTGRRGTVRTRARVPLAGLVVLGAGVLVAVAAAPAEQAPGILLGAVLVQLGMVLLSPALVGAAGRLAPYLPLAPRLALRDAARMRTRSAPAVAAVMAAVAGTAATLVVLASDDEQARQQYTPALRSGIGLVALTDDVPAQDVVAALRTALPGDVRAIGALDGRSCAGGCANVGIASEPIGSDAGCPGGCGYSTVFPGFPVGNAADLRLLVGRTSVEAERALAAGGVVVFGPREVTAGGTAQLDVYESGASAPPEPRRLEVPAAYLDVGPRTLPGFASTGLADRLGVRPEPAAVVVEPVGGLTVAGTDAAEQALAALGASSGLQVERGLSRDGTARALLLLVAVSAVVTTGAAGIATGLALADGRADQATLAAIGAAPRTRRRLAASQALVIAGLGSVLGVLAGFVPAVGYISAAPGFPLVVPWLPLGLVAVGAPAVAAAVCGLFARGTLPAVRRLA